jgi:hypothetical protein
VDRTFENAGRGTVLALLEYLVAPNTMSECFIFGSGDHVWLDDARRSQALIELVDNLGIRPSANDRALQLLFEVAVAETTEDMRNDAYALAILL